MFPRLLAAELRKSAKVFPIVTVCGPRQSGKTTLIRQVFPKKPYVNLEGTQNRAFAQEDPVGFLRQFPKGAVLDEVQRVPGLLSDLQVVVDEKKQPGLFILSGSQQLNLVEAISQSLAGRTQIHRLLPLSLQEIEAGFNYESWLIHGFYPGRLVKKIKPETYYQAYLESYVERDIRQLIQVKDLSIFERFLRLCAGRVGSLLNKESLARDVGCSPNTIEAWLSILEAAFVIYRLPAWYKNLNKRLIKSPKLYFYDVGLAAHLLGIHSVAHLTGHPLKGALFENLQVMEVVKYFFNQGKHPALYFYRDNHQHEIDLIIERGLNLLPIEIKSAETFTTHFLKGLSQAPQGDYRYPMGQWLVLGCAESYKRQSAQVVGWAQLANQLTAAKFLR